MITTAKEKEGFIDQKTFKTAEKYGFYLWFWPMKTCKFSMVTSRTLDLCLNPSAISFSSKEMATSMVNWTRSWANWFLMQLESTFILDVIAKIVDTQSLNQLTSEQHRVLSEDHKTALQLLKFTIKSNDREKLLWRVTKAYKSFKVPRVHKWRRMSIQDLIIQLPTRNFSCKSAKYQLLPPKKWCPV